MARIIPTGPGIPEKTPLDKVEALRYCVARVESGIPNSVEYIEDVIGHLKDLLAFYQAEFTRTHGRSLESYDPDVKTNLQIQAIGLRQMLMKAGDDPILAPQLKGRLARIEAELRELETAPTARNI